MQLQLSTSFKTYNNNRLRMPLRQTYITYRFERETIFIFRNPFVCVGEKRNIYVTIIIVVEIIIVNTAQYNIYIYVYTHAYIGTTTILYTNRCNNILL